MGTLTLVASDEGLRAVIWPDGRLDRVGLAGETLTPGDAQVLDATARQLDEYFAGTRREFDVEVDLRPAREFGRTVLEQLARVPYGELTTYGTLAGRAGKPRAARAVGTIMNRNPIPIVLPCHRVVGSSGSLVGYAGGLDRKRLLLELEGALTAG